MASPSWLVLNALVVHPTTGVLIVAHADDCLVLGSRADLVSLRVGLADEGYEVAGSTLGGVPGDVSELKFLGRTISLTDEGVQWSGDDKHQKSYLEKLVAEFGPESAERSSDMGMVKTPGVKRDEGGEVRVPLSKGQAKAYRGLAALGNYMGQDRPDIGFCCKEISKSMSDPCVCDIPALKRLGRYLRKYQVCAFMYYWQSPPQSIDGYSDADWGGDSLSRRSTSGGCLLHGPHMLSHWGRTQHLIS